MNNNRIQMPNDKEYPFHIHPLSAIRFAVVGDSHLSTLGYNPTTNQYILDESGNRYRRVLKRIASLNPGFVLHGGDSIGKTTSGRPPEEKYIAFRNVTRGILKNKPIFFTIGNWERQNLFQKYISPKFRGISDVPGTSGRVKIVILDNADGRFHTEDLSILKNLSSQYQYIIDFHWPLRIGKLTKSDSHVLSANQTKLFFNSIPSAVRNRIIAIFSHHLHSFYFMKNHIYSNFSNTSFFVTPCSGTYLCSTSGFLRPLLRLGTNNRYVITFNPATDFIKVK
jgi:hypothetical protein